MVACVPSIGGGVEAFQCVQKAAAPSCVLVPVADLGGVFDGYGGGGGGVVPLHPRPRPLRLPHGLDGGAIFP